MTTQTDSAVNKTKETYHHIYKDYAYRNAQPNDDVKEMLEYFSEQIGGAEILDVGCAEGRETEYLTNKGFKVTGCDISEDFVALARKRCPKSEFIVADMRSLPENLQLFDGIWACASFLHIPKADAMCTLKGFWDKLKPNGLLYISVLEGQFNAMRTNEKMNWPERHFSDYTVDEMVALLRSNGFIIKAIKQNRRKDADFTFLNFFATKVTN